MATSEEVASKRNSRTKSVHEKILQPNKISSEFIIFHPGQQDRRRSSGRAGRYSSASTGILEENDLEDKEDYDHYLRRGTEDPYGISTDSLITKHRQEERNHLEGWWIHSPIWRRTVPLMCITMLVLSICNAAAAIYMFTAKEKGDDFDVCKTAGCKDIAAWIKIGLDENLDPCNDFYLYACNKYSNREEKEAMIPERIDFSIAKFQFNQLGTLTTALKPENDPAKILIPFYKSCLSTTRRKDGSDIQLIAEIIEHTMPYLFTNLVNFNVTKASENITLTIGNNGFFRYQLLVFPNVAFLPPRRWILDFTRNFTNDKDTAIFEAEVQKSYTFLWNELEKHVGRRPVLNVDEAANLTTKLVRLLSGLTYKHTTDTNITDKDFIGLTNLLFGSLLRSNGDDWKPAVLEVETRKFTSGDLQLLVDTVNITFRTVDEERRALASYWIFCILQTYADEMTLASYLNLNLQVIFPDKRGLQEISLERFCFESLSEHLTGYAYKQFVRSLTDTHFLVETMDETFKQLRRAMRFIYFREGLREYLTPFQIAVLTRFMNPSMEIILNYPFPHDENSTRFFNELESYYLGLKPGSEFLLNLRDSVVSLVKGELHSWREGHIDHTKRQNFRLETFRSEIDNSVHYENNVYPPIVLFDRPLFLNDMRVFDSAGAILFLTRNLLNLWDKNLANPNNVLPLVTDSLPEFEKSQFLTNNFENYCMLKNKKIYPEMYFLGPSSRDALAFLIAHRLYRNPSDFRSLRHRGNGSIAHNVETVFRDNGLSDFVTVVRPNGVPPRYLVLQKSDFVEFKPEGFKFQFRKAPDGLEKYTEDQLFFLAAIRHHCYNFNLTESNKSATYAATVNAVLEQLEEFAEAWNCPINSPMNPPNKCIR